MRLLLLPFMASLLAGCASAENAQGGTGVSVMRMGAASTDSTATGCREREGTPLVLAAHEDLPAGTRVKVVPGRFPLVQAVSAGECPMGVITEQATARGPAAVWWVLAEASVNF